MNIKKKILVLLAAASLVASAAIPTVLAEEETTETTATIIVEENFDEYNDGWEPTNTLLNSHFSFEANSIGNGYIQVQENQENGNLHLKSHVFTSVYNTQPLTESYTFSISIFQTQGDQECNVFLRAPKANAAYYETDGSKKGLSCGKTGALLNFRKDALEVNIKSFAPKATETGSIASNVFSFPLPEGVTFNDGTSYTNVMIVDVGTEMNIYVEENLICRIAMTEILNRGYSRVNVSDPCYRNAYLFDADGVQVGKVDNALLQAKGATVGWATRNADMIVDDVCLMSGAAVSLPPIEIKEETESTSTSETDSSAGSTETTESTTESVTEATTTTASAVTTASGTEAETAAAGGCAGTVGMGAVALLCATAAGVALRKKH